MDTKQPTIFLKSLCLLPSISTPFIIFWLYQSSITILKICGDILSLGFAIEVIAGITVGIFPIQHLFIHATSLIAPEDNGINSIWYKSKSGDNNALRNKAMIIRGKMRKKRQ